MGAQFRSERLLDDALDRVLVNPISSAGWHGLLQAYAAVDDPEPRAFVRSKIVSQGPKEGVAGFLAASFMSGLEDGLPFVAVAGERVQTIRPVDTDRLMAFATYEWGRAVAAGEDRTNFVSRLAAAKLPEIVAMAARELARTSPGLAPRSVTEIRRVALVSPFLSFAGHPPTMLALKQADLLQNAGVTVEAFACQEALIPSMSDYLGNRGEVAAAPPDVDALAALAPAGLTMRLGDTDLSLRRRWLEMTPAIARFDPDLVLFVGLFSPLIASLYRTRPVLCLCIHSVAPMAPVDAWLTSDPRLANCALAPWGPSLPPAWGVLHPFRIALRPILAPLARAQLEVTDDAVVMVSVGARLGEEIAGEWAARMSAFLSQRPNLVWVLVGGAGACPSALMALPEDRLRLVAHQDDLRSVLRCCDLYVNPARMGGGFSVAEAMAEGLAVCALVDSDGGDKLGPHASADLDDYFERLTTLVDDPGARRNLGEALRDRFAATLDLDRSGPSLLAACETALGRFKQRAG